MAKIVLGLGTSHNPHAAGIGRDAAALSGDRPDHPASRQGRAPGHLWDLLEAADPKLAHMVAPEHLVARQNIARGAMQRLRQTVGAAGLDALIVMGRRPERKLSRGLPTGLCDLFRRHHPQRRYAAPDLFAFSRLVH